MILGLVVCILSPVVCAVLIWSALNIVLFYYQKFVPREKAASDILSDNWISNYFNYFSTSQRMKLWDTTVKIYLLYCFLCYPYMCSRILFSFNCRDMVHHTLFCTDILLISFQGIVGTFLRVDYSISCIGNDSNYESIKMLAIIGLILIPIGVSYTLYKLANCYLI